MYYGYLTLTVTTANVFKKQAAALKKVRYASLHFLLVLTTIRYQNQ